MIDQMWWIEDAGNGWWECVRYAHTVLKSIPLEPTIEYTVTYGDHEKKAIVWVFTEDADEKSGEIKDVVQTMPRLAVNMRYFLRREDVDLRDGNVRL